MVNYSLQKNQKGRENLIFDGFIHNLDKTIGKKKRWRCQTRKCKGALLENEDNIVEIIVPHNHERVHRKIEKVNVSNKLKEMALASKQSSYDIVTDITGNAIRRDNKFTKL